MLVEAGKYLINIWEFVLRIRADSQGLAKPLVLDLPASTYLI